MTDDKDTRQELIAELTALRQRVDELETALSEVPASEWDVFKTLPMPVYETDLSGRLLHYNDECLALFGYEHHEIAPDMKVDDFIHPDFIQETRERYARIQKDGSISGRIVPVLKKNGAVIYIKTFPSILERNGKPFKVRGTIVDVTEMRDTQEALRESEERYVLVVKGANDGIWDWDIDAEITYYSPRYKAMLGYEDHEFPNTGEAWREKLHPDDRERVLATTRPCETGKEKQFEVEYRMRHKDGSWRWILGRGGCLKNKKGKVYRLAGTHTDITERKKAEQAIRESEELHNALSRATFEGIFISENGNILAANHTASEMFGCEHGEFIGFSLTDFVADDFRELTRNNIRTGREDPYEVMAVHKDGTVFPVEIQEKTFVFKNKEARVVAVRDVTRRKQAEDRYRGLFENATEGIYQSTPDGRFLTTNKSFADILGYDDTEELIDSILDIRSQMYAEGADRDMAIETMKRHGKILDFETRVKRRDGSIIWISESARMVYDDSGDFLYFEGFIKDITERRINQRTTQVLYEISSAVSTTSDLQELYRTIHGVLSQAVDATNFHIALLNEEEGTLTFPYSHDECQEDFRKINLSELKGNCPTLDVIRSNKPLFITHDRMKCGPLPDTHSENPTAAVWLGVPLTVKGRAIGAMAIQHYSDKDHYTDSDIKLMTAASEQVGLAIERKGTEEELFRLNEQLESMVLDRTRQLLDKARELEMANQRLKELDKLKSALISSISHELRTPLTSIRGFAKLTLKDFERYFERTDEADPKLLKRSERLKQNLRIVESEGERLTRLINDFLDLNRIESGRMEWNDRMIAPGIIARSAANSVMGQFVDNSDVEFVQNIEENLPGILVDPDRIQQVLINLLHNASKFTTKGEVRMIVEQKGGVIRFTVSDTGIGIPKEDQQMIFEKFQKRRQGDTLSGVKEGTGLGLAICRELISRYGGSIWVESAPGQGSDFIFDIPIQPVLP